MLLRIVLLIVALPLLAGCDLLYDALDVPNPTREAARLEEESRAIGGACRHAGRSLEDCYTINSDYPRAAIFAGWRDMNDYMQMNNLQEVPSRIPQPGEPGYAASRTEGEPQLEVLPPSTTF